jgi:hypothetical protein
MKPLTILLCCLTIAGCSMLSNKMSWTKANTPADEAQADLDTCESLAHEHTKKDRDITQDIDAASGADSGGVPSAPDMEAYQSRQDYNEILSTCMAELGYTKAP